MGIKGQIPWNKGLKGAQIAWNKGTKGLIKPNKGSFKPGPEAPSWKGGVSIGANRKQYYYVQTAKRVALKRGAGGSFTQEDWERLKQTFLSRCLRCGKFEPEIKLSIDHITPISKGGDNNITNIQPLCLRCNILKRATTFNYMSLERYADKP